MVLGLFLVLFLLDFFIGSAGLKKYSYEYHDVINEKQQGLIKAHLVIVYVAVGYVYGTKGIVVLHQDLRFLIPTSISYVIKSSIYIPLIYWLSRCLKDRLGIFFYVFLPLLPAILIGSRGTVIMILFGMVLIQFLQSYYYKGEEERGGLNLKNPFLSGSLCLAEACCICSIIFGGCLQIASI